MGKTFICTLYAISFVFAFHLVSCTTDLKDYKAELKAGKKIGWDINSKNEIEVRQEPPISRKKELTESQKRTALQKVYISQVGVREKTGKNDGPEVEAYLKSTNLGPGFAWCAAFVKWCFDQINHSVPITAWSPTAHNSKNIVYFRNRFEKQPQQGDVFTLYYPNKGRIGHTGFYDKMNNESMVQTVEGNTNGAGSREGDGVYIKFRPLKTIHSITSWLP